MTICLSIKALFVLCFHIFIPRLKHSKSAIGPRAKAGKKLSAPTNNTTNTNKKTNSGEQVDNVPAVTATFFFCTMLPAIAKIPKIGINLTK